MGKRILIVEDDSDIVEVVTRILERKGYQVFIAMDGIAALEKARRESPDLIILDLDLPKLSGEEVCKEIRRDEKLKITPVIMLTGKSSDVDKVVGRVIGADQYLTKPFEINTLLKVINETIGKVP